MRAISVIFLLLGALAMNGPFFHPLMHAERSIRSLPPTVLGNKAVISPGAGALVVPSIQVQLDHPEDFQLTLALIRADGEVGTPAIGTWRIEWGSGGANAVAFVDGSSGVTIPLHASFLKVQFETSDPLRVNGFASASIGEHTHGNLALPPTFTQVLPTSGIVPNDAAFVIPPFARNVIASIDPVAVDLEIIFLDRNFNAINGIYKLAGPVQQQVIVIPGNAVWFAPQNVTNNNVIQVRAIFQLQF